MAAPEPGGWRHVPALDGFRGVAVIVVLLFHGGVSWARGGFLGVDAFFVLSGLLITSLLLDEAARTGAVDLGRFWSRRARRLLPALLALIAVAGLYGALLAPRGSLSSLRRDGLAALLYVANWRFIDAGADYFEATAAPSVLRHTWSLAIEEQFYLLWPLAVFVVVAGAKRHRLGWTALIAGIGIAASAAAMWVQFTPGGDTTRAYYGTDTRVQVVLTGALLAVGIAALRRRAPEGIGVGWQRVLAALAAAGAGAFLGAAALAEGTETALFRGGFLTIALAVAAVLAHVVLVPAGWSSRLLAFGPLRAVGLVSYGLYLWHWPVFLTLTHARTGLSGAGLLAAKLAVTALISVVSYFALEMPIRRGAFPRLQGALLVPATMALAAAAILVGTEPPPVEARPAAAVPRTPSGFPASLRPAREPGTPARVLVVGDSVAKTLADHVDRPALKAGLAMTNKGVLGCGVVRGGPFRYFGRQQSNPKGCDSWPRQWAEHVSRHDPDVVLAILGRWEVMDRVHDGRWTALGDPAFDRYIEQELEEAVRVLTAGNATLALTTAPYYLRGERPDGGRWPEDDPARVDRFNQILRAVAARHPDRVAVLDLNARTSRGGQYTPVIDGVSVRYDGVHFSPQGSRWLSPWLFAALEELAPPIRGGGPRSSTTTSSSSSTTVRPAPATTVRRPTSTTAAPSSTTTTSEAEPVTTTTTAVEPPPTTTTTLPV